MIYNTFSCPIHYLFCPMILSQLVAVHQVIPGGFFSRSMYGNMYNKYECYQLEYLLLQVKSPQLRQSLGHLYWMPQSNGRCPVCQQHLFHYVSHGGQPNPTVKEKSTNPNIYLHVSNICPYLTANQHCRNVSERINGGDLFYLSLPAVYAVEGFVTGDVVDKYGSMSTSEVALYT